MKILFRIKMITARFETVWTNTGELNVYVFRGNGQPINSDRNNILNIYDIMDRYEKGTLKTGDMLKIVVPENESLNGITGTVETEQFM